MNISYIVTLDERLDAEEPKIVALQSLTASHTTDIASNTANISTKQERITTLTDLTCNTISGIGEVTQSELTLALNTNQPNILSTDNLTCNNITVSKTTPIENDELTSKMYVDNKLAEKQDNILSTTDLTCNKISTQLGSVGTTNSIMVLSLQGHLVIIFN